MLLSRLDLLFFKMRPDNLNAQSPRLTETAKANGFEHPNRCGSCGRPNEHCPVDHGLTRWQEHDHYDRPEPRLVVLCRACSNKLIEVHVRLYRPLGQNEPWAGCMALCIGCRWRLGIGCTHQRAKSNGGPGVAISIEPPLNAFVDGTRRGGKRTGWRELFYPEAPRGCAQFEKVE